MLTTSENKTDSNASKEWFDNMVSSIRVDELMLEQDVLEAKRKQLYEAMISGNDTFLHNYARNNSTAFFIQNIIKSYLLTLAEYKAKPRRLGLDLSVSKVLVWAEIEDDDEVTEDALILASARVNNDFSEYGFHISSTIVEAEDDIDIPNHYKQVRIKAN